MTTHTPDNLFAGDYPVACGEVTVKSGEDLSRGAVLGRELRKKGTVAADGGNTGNGAISGTSIGKSAIIGDYILTCVEAITDGGRFAVIDPHGNRLEDLAVGTAYSNDHIAITVADGSTDWAADDFITFPVEAEALKCVAVDSTLLNGAGEPYAILAEDTDASLADAVAPIYLTGIFNESFLSFGGSDDEDTHREALREINIHLKTVVSA